MMKLNQVSKTYYNGDCPTHALRGIDLQIEQGEYIAIMGTSGSGKSTLLNIIGGMDNLTEGEYYYNDIAVHELKNHALHLFRKEHVSFIFQQFALMNQYTVFENVQVPLLAKGYSKRDRKRIVMEKLELLGIADLAKKRPIHISGGQQQRCAIARALASDNELVLADEPTGALDKNTSMEIMDIIGSINKQGKTVILITHDSDVAAMANRVVHLEDGQIVSL